MGRFPTGPGLFGLRIIRVCVALEGRGVAGVNGRQLVRSGTSVGAQYREACRARSRAEFISDGSGGTDVDDDRLRQDR